MKYSILEVDLVSI